MTRKERYYYLKLQHRCTNCGKRDDRTLSGKVACKSCANLMNGIMMKRQKNLRDSGMCVSCGKAKAVSWNMCQVCSERIKSRARKQTIKQCRESLRDMQI